MTTRSGHLPSDDLSSDAPGERGRGLRPRSFSLAQNEAGNRARMDRSRTPAREDEAFLTHAPN
eukprot:730084-Amphidinium_carterae.1